MRESSSVPSFPEIEDKLGYNPARFLDVSRSKRRNQIGETSPFATTEALIPGLNDSETIQGWIIVEGELGRGKNGGPRKDVIRQLYERRAQLQNAEDDQPSVPTPDDDCGQESLSDTNGKTSTPAAETPKSVDQPAGASDPPTNADTPLAADGGEESPPDPPCPVCGTPLIPEEIAGKVGYWCSPCGEFREPVATEAHA